MIGWVAGLAMTIWVCFGTTISFLWYAMVGCVATMAVGFVLSVFQRPSGSNGHDGHDLARSLAEPRS
jgi:hypothetical protein